MNELRIASRPLLELILESVSINLFYTQTTSAIEEDPQQKAALVLHTDELQQMHDHLTDLLKS